MSKIEMDYIIKLHESITIPTLLYDAETWPLNATMSANLDRMELWAWKSMIGLPKTTPTAAVIFCCGALYPSIRIKTKQLLYLHKVLSKEENHWTLQTLQDLRERDIGWAKQIEGILSAWGLEEDWNTI